ncbi:hypothetical protein ACLB2K_012595 [Fragaria x ananassa]
MGNKSWKSSPVFISEEILIEILLRLPVKSLIRFSCVSKSWRDVIRSSSFITNHLSKNMTRYSNRYLIANYPVDPSTVEPDLCQYNLYSSETFEQFLKLEHPLWTTIGRFEQCLRLKCSLSTASRCVIYGSSNGLLCISDSDVVTQSPICIWNPSIRKFKILPQPTLYHLDHYCFDTVLSFGFHPVLKDYKVVMLQCFDVVEEGDLDVKIALGVQVYTFSTNSWKMNEVMRLDWDWKPCAKCAVLNGISYWLAEEVSAEASVFRILSFDTGNEEFEHFRVPDAIANVDGGLYIEVYKDSICLLEVDYCSCEDDDGGHIYVWLLQEQTFNLLQTIVLPSSGTCIPLGFTMDNQLLVEVLEDDDDNYQLALFVPESKQLLRTPILLPVHTRSQVHTYNESLVLLDDERVSSVRPKNSTSLRLATLSRLGTKQVETIGARRRALILWNSHLTRHHGGNH